MNTSPAKVPAGSNRQNVVDFIATLLDASTEYAIICIDIDGRILLWNEGARRIYGHQPEEVVGRANFAVLSTTNEVAQGKPREILESVLCSGKWEGVLDCIRKDGQQFFARVVVTIRHDGNGAVAGFLVVSKDITNEIRLETAHSESRAILDAVSEAILLISPDERLLTVNRCFSEFFGIPSDEVVGQPLSVLYAQLAPLFVDPSRLQKLLAGTISAHQPRVTEFVVQCAPQKRELELYSTPVFSSSAEYLGRLHALRDVTHEREVDRMKSEFVSLVSHELRTPLTSIQGYIDLILTDEEVGPLTELQLEFLSVAKSNARRLVSLINNLLDLSRIESGKIELHRESLNLNHLIRELIPSFQPQLDTKQQVCTLHLPEQAPIVQGDAERIIQILSNLLSNAHKYTPQGGHIDLAVEVVGTVARTAVTDSGIGLSNKEQAQLFKRFYRAQNALTESIGGTGLGLSITRSLVELHGGEIQVFSEPGKGSTFCFTLPLVQQWALPTPRRKGGPGKCILVVDDEPDIAHLLQHYLEGAGYLVLGAATGTEAFQLAKTAHPDLIALDMLLPDTSGLTVLEWLKSDASTSSIPVMILSIADDDGRWRLLGAIDYFHKPIKPDILLPRIAAVFTDQVHPPHTARRPG